MLEVVFHPLPEFHTTSRQVPVPSPGPLEIVIKVEVASSNPKDWIHPLALGLDVNSGDDLAGTVYAVGSEVRKNFKVGERVAAFHQMLKPYGAYAEYSVAPAHTVFRIPSEMSFEEAATIPLVSMTAAITLFRRQGFQPPWLSDESHRNQGPLIVYGASSALGTTIVELAKLAGIHPIVAIGGKHASHLKSLLSSSDGDTLIDYHEAPEKLKQHVHEALAGQRAHHAVDVISDRQTWIPVAQMLATEAESLLSVTSGSHAYDEPEIPSSVRILYTYVGTAHSGKYLPHMPKQPSAEEAQGDISFASDFFNWIEGLLKNSELGGHPHEVIPGGLDGVQVGLKRLRAGDTRGNKFVYRIRETKSLIEAHAMENA